MIVNQKGIVLPLPPLSDMENVPAFNESPVTVILINNKRLEGSLLKFDVANALIEIRLKDSDEEREILMYDIKTMHLNTPLQITPDPAAHDQEKRAITISKESQNFLVTFRDKSKLRGKTYGTRVDKNGIHLFKEHSTNQYIQQYLHIFIPKSSIESNLIGEQIGSILIKEGSASPEAIEQALEEQHEARSRPLGDYLIEHKVVDSDQLEKALKRQKSMPNLRLGEILVSEKLIDNEQLTDALAEQKTKRSKPLGEILIAKGVVSREQIQLALAKKLGIPFINLQEFKVTPDITTLIPASLAFKHKVIPLYQYEGKLAVAIDNPMDWEALDAMRFHTGKYIEPVMCMPEEINWALQFYYSSDDVLHAMGPIDDEEGTDDDEGFIDDNTFSVHEEEEVSENIVVKIINKIIMDAYQQGVSDIHIEPNPGKSKLIVRFRKDGTLHIYHKFPSHYRNALTSRIKVMARLDISERRKPQDGKIAFRQYGPADIELRIATLPTQGGLEDVVMRILTSGKNMPVSALGLSSNNLDRVLYAISQPYGLFLVCGPTGSGKTTTLHSVMGHLNDSERKIWTAEDPVEITQPGLRQVQVNPKIGLTFANAMRAFLRADPDIIMVGEMRDEETAGMGIEASLTGHLVLSTLHTNSAAESIVRLLDMGMDPFNFADALQGILAQRLAKTLCPTCKTPYNAQTKEIEFLANEYSRELLPLNHGEDESQALIKKTIEQWHQTYDNRKGKLSLYKAPGCKDCNDTGYRGRIGLHEMLSTNPKIKQMILTHAPAADIHRESLQSGMRTLKQDGIEKVLQGYTDYSMVRSVCIK
ncbi:GspE/PulE family protein [Pseudomonadota bacterium]